MLQSPPSRRRGLKWFPRWRRLSNPRVASFSEAGIEMQMVSIGANIVNVASFSEAWIEIYTSDGVSVTDLSRLLLGGVD